MIDVLYLLLGLGLLVIGGELLIRSSLTLARKLNVSPMLTGLIIVGFGTSAPELAVSVDAAIQGKSDIAIGNVVGSNIGNALLILGLCAVISPLLVSMKTLKRDGRVVLVSTVLLIILSFDGILSIYDGGVLFVLLIAYMSYVWCTETADLSAEENHHVAESQELRLNPKSSLLAWIGILAGLACLIGGAQLLLFGATRIAHVFEISEALIGLTVVAIGTSLPELTVSILATIRGHAAVAVGNVLGSNIFNILGILAVSAMVQPLGVSEQIKFYDRWVLLAAMLLMCLFLYSGRRIGLIEGSIMLVLYVTYLTVGVTVFSVS